MRKTIALCAVSALLISAACSHDRGAMTTTTGAGVIGNEDSVQRLTAQRCQREGECNEIGAGKSYEDLASCEREVSHDLRSSLRSEQCPYGIREDKMNECADELKNEKCGNPFDMVSRLAKCRTGRLCIK